MDQLPAPDPKSPAKTAKYIARRFFGVGPDPASRRKALRQMLIAAVLAILFVPALFYLEFGEVGPLGWGLTIFLVVYCLLAATGIYFLPKTEYHSHVPIREDWLDRLGAFWLVCCVFGPFLGWVLTSAFPLTITSWRWLYGTRVFLAAVLPIITAIPLFRYVRGRSTWIALPILVIITLLPIWSVVKVSQDLWQGPTIKQIQAVDENSFTTTNELYLSHTHRIIEVKHQ